MVPRGKWCHSLMDLISKFRRRRSVVYLSRRIERTICSPKVSTTSLVPDTSLALPLASPAGRSAAFQLLGDVIVRGRDPPDALCALLDSLRHPGLPMENATARLYIGNPSTVGPAKHAALYSELLAKGAGSGNSSGCGDESNGKRAKREDLLLIALELMLRRLLSRSLTAWMCFVFQRFSR